MAKSLPRTVRRRLEELWDTVQLSENERVTDDGLLAMGIRRLNLDLDNPPEEQTASDAPILLSLLPQEQLDSHPIDLSRYEQENSLEGLLFFEDYSPNPDRDKLDHQVPASETESYVYYWATSATRIGFPYRGPPHPDNAIFDLAQKVGWDKISLPHPWYLFTPLSHFARSHARQTKCCLGPILEWGDKVEPDVSKFANLTIFAANYGTGNDESMQIGELKAIISAMKSRSKQLNIPKDEQEDSQYDREELLKKWYPLAFPNESRFPVVLVSFLGPQHGRICYASMHGKSLIIHQSRLYSFEHKATAPFDLFTRWIMYTPVTEKEQ